MQKKHKKIETDSNVLLAESAETHAVGVCAVRAALVSSDLRSAGGSGYF